MPRSDRDCLITYKSTSNVSGWQYLLIYIYRRGLRVMMKEIRPALGTLKWTRSPLTHPHPPNKQ